MCLKAIHFCGNVCYVSWLKVAFLGILGGVLGHAAADALKYKSPQTRKRVLGCGVT